MPVFVDNVRVWLLTPAPTLVALLVLLYIALQSWRYRMSPRSSVMFHIALYFLFVQAVYLSGRVQAGTFFLFPADKLVRLIHRDHIIGGLSLFAVCCLWGWLIARIHIRLWRRACMWHSPQTVVDWIAMDCSIIMGLFWLRYLVIWLIILLPSTYLPSHIGFDKFDLDIFMMSRLLPVFIIGVISALLSTHKSNLLRMNLIYLAGVGGLVPLTDALIYD